MKIEKILDNLTEMVLAIKGDKHLESAILSLSEKNQTERSGIIALMSERMLAEKKDEQFVKTFRMLSDKKLFDLTIRALDLS